MDETSMWIGGAWTGASDGATGEVLDPSSGEVIANVPKATLADVDAAVAASRAAFEDRSWGAIDPAQRGRILQKMAAVTYAEAKNLATIESRNNGKTFREALSEI
ncbi:MAG: aldehyde dehydrogenase family protein, partial [Candidatus Thermoplasmatota archaeon]|nr:aldehyde dehydrogenase family protein [Candidatus Thermoplasmatota archaeon]